MEEGREYWYGRNRGHTAVHGRECDCEQYPRQSEGEIIELRDRIKHQEGELT